MYLKFDSENREGASPNAIEINLKITVTKNMLTSVRVPRPVLAWRFLFPKIWTTKKSPRKSRTFWIDNFLLDDENWLFYSNTSPS